ncbi:MAG: hypothetical protein JXM74_01720 [Fusobacteriaceae bacterium]|nr:hypothetical protein [Fusobacteriaceae bacterium]MBN2837452.1 hypothetical protein [Fusobacteriaceae bacterium]
MNIEILSLFKSLSNFIYNYWLLSVPFLILYLKNTLPKLTADILTKKFELDKKLTNDKILETLKAEFSKENTRHSIEYSQIQQYKVKTMVDFLTYFSNYFFDKDLQNKIQKNPKELMKFNLEFAKFGNHLMLFAGDETIKRYSDFRELGKTEGNEKLYLKYYSQLVLSLRKDIGYSHSELNEVDFLSLWITDKKEAIEKLIKDE